LIIPCHSSLDLFSVFPLFITGFVRLRKGPCVELLIMGAIKTAQTAMPSSLAVRCSKTAYLYVSCWDMPAEIICRR
jgi:hypothetical protein